MKLQAPPNACNTLRDAPSSSSFGWDMLSCKMATDCIFRSLDHLLQKTCCNLRDTCDLASFSPKLGQAEL